MKYFIGMMALSLCALTAGGAAAQADDGAYCREYTQQVVIGNHTAEAYGTTCMQPDGSWKIISRHDPDEIAAPQPDVPAIYEPVVYQPPVYEEIYYREYHPRPRVQTVYVVGGPPGWHHGRGRGHHKHWHH